MKTSHALPRLSSQIDHPPARAKQKPTVPPQSLPRDSRSYNQLPDTFGRESAACQLRHSASTPRLVTPAVKKAHDGPAPKLVTFPTHTQINRRLSETSLWPPQVTSKMVAALYKLCGIPIVREADMTYSVKDAARAIDRVLQGASQMVNVEQMRALQVFLANVYACDEELRAGLKAELRKCWDPQGK